MDTLLSLLVGVGLSAACGFRVFVPLLITSIAGLTGHLTLSPGFSWIGTYPALIAFSAATVLEIGAYYVPWLDNFLDSISSPAAVVAGTILTASMVTNMDPYLKWTLAVIAGGGAAGLVQGATVLTRGASSLGTAGLANPIVSTLELFGSIAASAIAFLFPFAVILILAAAAWGVFWFVRRRNRLRRPAVA